MQYSQTVLAQTFTVSGYVLDSSSHEALIGASIYFPENPRVYTFSNEYGFFSLRTNLSKIHLRVGYTGFSSKDIFLRLNGDTVITVLLSSSAHLRPVVVTQKKQVLTSAPTGYFTISPKAVKNLPSFLGEQDPLKTMQFMPGVVGSTDGTNGLSIRGGSPDQNLYLLDGVPVYNPNHALGVFSIFNSDAIKSLRVYKSGFPAYYGGRLSSVIDVRTKEGDLRHYHGAVQAGMMTLKAFVQGPIKTSKASFLFSIRRSFIDLLMAPVVNYMNAHDLVSVGLTPGSGTEKVYPKYYFYDIFAKVNRIVSKKDRIFFSFYFGRDFTALKYNKASDKQTDDYIFSQTYDDYFGSHWGNTILSFRWNHQFNPDLFMNMTSTYSSYSFLTAMDINYHYDYTVFDQNATYVFDQKVNSNYASELFDYGNKLDFYYTLGRKHYLRFGGKVQYHKFYPAALDWSESFKYHSYTYSSDTTIGKKLLTAKEGALYLQDSWAAVPWLKINYGFRLSAFDVRDTSFIYIEPRMDLSLLPLKNFVIKFSYDRSTQFLHYLSNNIAGFPTDVWLPATNLIVPEKAWQVAGQITWFNDVFTLSSGLFYKQMYNLVEYKEGQSIFSAPLQGGLGEIWERKVTQGKGWAYGWELLLRKDIGKWTGWLAYTLSWSWRQFDQISFGQPFPYHYDRRHVLNAVIIYKLKPSVNLSATWTFASGNPITLIEGEFLPYERLGTNHYSYNGNEVWYLYGYGYFSGRNNYRLPAYHRLDLSASFTKKKQKYTRIFTVGLYNAYDHLNPSHVFINRQYIVENGQIVRKTTLRIYTFWPIMPMISWKAVF